MVVVLPWVPVTTIGVRPGSHQVLDGLGLRGVGEAAVEAGLELGVAAGDGVADHDEVRARVEVLGAVGRGDGDPEALELGRHRRVDVLVGAGDPVPEVEQELGERGHRRPGDPDQVDVHGARG